MTLPYQNFYRKYENKNIIGSHNIGLESQHVAFLYFLFTPNHNILISKVLYGETWATYSLNRASTGALKELCHVTYYFPSGFAVFVAAVVYVQVNQESIRRMIEKHAYYSYSLCI